MGYSVTFCPNPIELARKLAKSIVIPKHAEAGKQQFESLAHANEHNPQLKLDPHWIHFYANATQLILTAASWWIYTNARLVPLLLFNNINLPERFNKIRPLLSFLIMISLQASEQKTELLSAESLTKYGALISLGFLFEKALRKITQDNRGAMRAAMHDYASLFMYACLFPLVWSQIANYLFSSDAAESARKAALTTLNLTTDATPKDIQDAYRFFTRMCHGDLGGRCMADVNAAKDILLPKGPQS